MSAASDLLALTSAVATVLGTLVGFFFGVQAGADGKEKIEERRILAEHRLEQMAALAATANKTEAMEILKAG